MTGWADGLLSARQVVTAIALLSMPLPWTVLIVPRPMLRGLAAGLLPCCADVGLGNIMSVTGKRAGRFERPVIIRTDGNDRMVVDVNTAAEVLLRAFPRETARRKAAMAACLRVIRGEAHPPFARQAFVSAALEVGILAGD